MPRSRKTKSSCKGNACCWGGSNLTLKRHGEPVPKAEQLWAWLELEGFIAKCSIHAFEGLCNLQEVAFGGEIQLQTQHCTHTATPKAEP